MTLRDIFHYFLATKFASVILDSFPLFLFPWFLPEGPKAPIPSTSLCANEATICMGCVGLISPCSPAWGGLSALKLPIEEKDL